MDTQCECRFFKQYLGHVKYTQVHQLIFLSFTDWKMDIQVDVPDDKNQELKVHNQDQSIVIVANQDLQVQSQDQSIVIVGNEDVKVQNHDRNTVIVANQDQNTLVVTNQDLSISQHEHPEGKKRALQQVVTRYARKEVILWMTEDAAANGERNLASRAVRAFPVYFRGNEKANLQKASRWYKHQVKYLDEEAEADLTDGTIMTHVQPFKRARAHMKCAPGRGRNRAPWVTWLYGELLDEFHRLRKSGIDISTKSLVDIAHRILIYSNSEYNHLTVDPKDGRLIMSKISGRWVQAFMDSHNIVLQRNRLTSTEEKQLQLERLTAHHLGVLSRGFSSGEFHEDFIENVDETHFVINRYSMMLGFRSDKEAAMISGGEEESITVIVRITGGRRAQIQTPMLVFTNANRNYPIEGVPDDVAGACYRTAPKGWVDEEVFSQYFDEPRTYQGDPLRRLKHVWVDSCNGNNDSKALQEVLTKKNTVLRFFPPSCNHMCQPAESVVAKIKDVWHKRWDARKMNEVSQRSEQGIFVAPQGDAIISGKSVAHPGNHYFLTLAAESIRAVNAERDANGVSHARKAMIRCGLSLDVDGNWSVRQLSPELQRIVQQHRIYFDGAVVPDL